MKNHEKSEKEKVQILKNGIKDGKHVFLLIFMDGCGPCNETKPKWFEFEDKHSVDNDVVIVDIEQGSLGEIENLIGESPAGFPCMRYIKNGKIEEYEDCANIDKTNLRSAESFGEWLKEKTGKSQEGGKKRQRPYRKPTQKKTKNKMDEK